MTNFESVKKFMETFGQEIKEKACFPNDKIISLRYDLIKEELEELKEAMIKGILKKLQMLNRYSLCNLWSRTCIWNRFR